MPVVRETKERRERIKAGIVKLPRTTPSGSRDSISSASQAQYPAGHQPNTQTSQQDAQPGSSPLVRDSQLDPNKTLQQQSQAEAARKPGEASPSPSAICFKPSDILTQHLKRQIQNGN
ncbi:MAG: hypothetical protein M1813_008828 [Trichoglossum hirsutum]|nr:MAG: hypothetical protein M1813_008828 [Trichoglossum hirsutum]